MQSLVGIIRTEGELRKALEEIAVFKQRLGRVRVSGGRDFNPAWHLALDLYSMLSVSEAVTLGAIDRKESRGGHTRDDYPFADDRFGKVNMVVRRRNGQFTVTHEPMPEMPDELKQLLQERK
jgi:succinate dehydrogenase / fumarate reductase flavoprotein subunit